MGAEARGQGGFAAADDALTFVMRNSISFLSAPAAGLTAGGTFMLLFDRYAAVTLLALVFAVRSRVAR